MGYQDGDYGHQNGSLDHSGDGGGHDEGSAVFISNLQWWTTDAELEQLCAAYGHVLNIRFIDDKACGKSRGMAILEFAEADAATQCINGLNGRDINGRPCRVSYQQQRNQPGASSSGQYGGGRGMGSSMSGGRGPSGGGGRGRGGSGMGSSMGGRGGSGGRGSSGAGAAAGGMDDMGGADMMGAAAMMGPGGMMMMPGVMGMGGMMPGMMPGMMGMGMPGMEMMQGMMMAPFGMPGMAGFKPPPPPGGPPKKE